MDEEYQQLLVEQIVHRTPIPLIGVNVADTGFYLGSGFTWLSTIPYLIGQGHPLANAWAAALLGAVTAGSMVWVVNSVLSSRTGAKGSLDPGSSEVRVDSMEIVNSSKGHTPAYSGSAELTVEALPLSRGDYLVGFLAGLFYAVNPLINLYDRKWWNPSLIPLLVVWWLWAVFQCHKSQVTSHKWGYVVLALVFGLAFHVHYSLLGLIPVTFYIFFRNGYFQRLKAGIGKNGFQKIVLPLGVFLLLIAPLVIFELRHDFIQTNGFLEWVSNANSVSGDLEQPTVWLQISQLAHSLDRLFWLGRNRDMAAEYGRCVTDTPYHPVVPVGLGFLLVGGWLWSKPAHRFLIQVMGGVLITFLLGLVLYPRIIPEYYLLVLFPLLLILLAVGVWRGMNYLKKNSVVYTTLIAMIGFGLAVWTSQSLSLRNNLGWSQKESVLALVKHYVGDEPYHLEVNGTCYAYEGYRYIAKVLDITPVSSYIDLQLGWLYPAEITTKPTYEVILIKLDDRDDPKVLEWWQRYQKRWGSLRLEFEEKGWGIVIVKR